jgi:hypothetical protein
MVPLPAMGRLFRRFLAGTRYILHEYFKFSLPDLHPVAVIAIPDTSMPFPSAHVVARRPVDEATSARGE